jgi:hypothetical protein
VDSREGHASLLMVGLHETESVMMRWGVQTVA